MKMARTKFDSDDENKSDDEVILRRKSESPYFSNGHVTPDTTVTDIVECGNAVLLVKSKYIENSIKPYLKADFVERDGNNIVVITSMSKKCQHEQREITDIPWAPIDNSDKDSSVHNNGSTKSGFEENSNISGLPGSSGSSTSGSSSVKLDTFIRRSFSNIWRKSFNRKRSSYKDSSCNFTSSSSSGSEKSDLKDFKQIIVQLSSTNVENDNDNANSSQTSENLKCIYNDSEEHFEDYDYQNNLTGGERRNSTDSSGLSTRSTNSICVGIRSAPSSPMAPLQGQSDTHGQSVVSLNTITRSPSHHNATKLDSKPLKQLTTSALVAPARLRTDIPEKKRKELSSSREKKFHRHFQQVSKEERLINYYSCALVSDILLQGHLYITHNYFAFYSNVFGFVTKLLIPTASVIKISKEKTAKIIPNAVGVTTAEERHVFGSFMSREAAFRLMCSVCPPLEPIESIQKVPDVEVSEECSVEDDSSCSISGNESPPQILECTSDASQILRQRTLQPHISTDVVDSPKELVATLSAPKQFTTPTPINWPKSPPPRIVSSSRKCNAVYLGVVLAVVLAVFSAYLYHRILEIESRIDYNPSDFKIDPDNDLDVYAETLKWQKEMEMKSAQETQSLINSHLELIARLRKSLESLSLLIHHHNILFETMRQRSSAERSSGDDASMEQNLTT